VREPGHILLISCYELGHPPFAVASAAGFLERAGFRPDVLDVAVERFDEAKARRARLVLISVPMHTALRLGVRVAERVRAVNPGARIAFFGLYATLNDEYLRREAGAVATVGGELEEGLVALAREPDSSASPSASASAILKRLPFAVPSRSALPPLERYARLIDAGGEERVAGYVEASRGCLHLCRHCPIPPVYGGRFFVLPREVVLEDVRRQVAAGATHVTFGDPDFLNGPGHSLAIARALHAEHPRLTFDVTTKVEHILKYRQVFQELAACGCIFVVTAAESLSDRVLGELEKGHARADVGAALAVVRGAGIALRPTWVPFTPWETLAGYVDILEFIEREGLVDHVDPVQYSIRLLIPPGSALLGRPGVERFLRGLDEPAFCWRWTHPDPRMDRLQAEVAALVASDAEAGEDAAATVAKVRALAEPRRPARAAPPGRDRRRAPRLSEPWFC